MALSPHLIPLPSGQAADLVASFFPGDNDAHCLAKGAVIVNDALDLFATVETAAERRRVVEIARAAFDYVKLAHRRSRPKVHISRLGAVERRLRAREADVRAEQARLAVLPGLPEARR